MNNTMSLEGCLNMYGAHIKLCIKDYSKAHNKIKEMKEFVSHRYKTNTKKATQKGRLVQIIFNYDTAKAFLFDGGLDNAVHTFSLPLNPDYVRQQAIKFATQGGMNEERIVDTLDDTSTEI